MQKTFRTFVSSLAVMTLAACGGGNGGAVAPVEENLAEITSANAESIASAVMKATFEGGDLGAFAGGSGDISGSTTLSGDLANPETLSPNDVITIQFDACNDGFSEVDCTMTMTIRSFSSDSAESVSFEVTVEVTNFTVIEGDSTSTANGDITLGMDFPLSGALTMTISSGSLTISDGTTTETLANFSLSQTIDPVTGAYSVTASGNISSTVFSGSVNFTTSTAFEGLGAEEAHLGAIVITGKDGASIRIDVLDEQFVRLSVDVDGDNVVDNVFDLTWEELA